MNKKINLKIMKFGGSSVGTVEAIVRTSNIITHDLSKNKIVVVSAQQGVTDKLLGLVNGKGNLVDLKNHLNNIIRQLNIQVPEVQVLFFELEKILKKKIPANKLKDLVASFGERISANMISTYLNSKGLKAAFVDSRKIVVTNSSFNNADYLLEKTRINCIKILNPILRKKIIPIVTGFIGQNVKGETTTLGRGGSDLTGTLLGQCLSAEVIEIWTDVDGIMTSDPRNIKDTSIISELTYKETIELSNFGAKVMYGRALIPAMESNIPVYVLNTFNPSSPGTLIHSKNSLNSFAVTAKESITIVTVYNPKMIGAAGFLADFFNIFGKLKLSVDVVSVSEASISVTVQKLSEADKKLLIANLEKFGEIELKDNCAIIAIISNLKKKQELFSLILENLKNNGIHISLISYGNSEINLTLVISDSSKTKQAVSQIHKLLSLTQLT